MIPPTFVAKPCFSKLLIALMRVSTGFTSFDPLLFDHSVTRGIKKRVKKYNTYFLASSFFLQVL